MDLFKRNWFQGFIKILSFCLFFSGTCFSMDCFIEEPDYGGDTNILCDGAMSNEEKVVKDEFDSDCSIQIDLEIEDTYKNDENVDSDRFFKLIEEFHRKFSWACGLNLPAGFFEISPKLKVRFLLAFYKMFGTECMYKGLKKIILGGSKEV